MHHLRSAQDLPNASTTRSLTASPAAFDGTLEELFERHIVPNLPRLDDVADFHRALRAYTKRPDALFLIRQMRGTQRRSTYTTRTGVRFKATDGAPAWWAQRAVFSGARVGSDAIADVIATMPAHQFDTLPSRAASAEQKGWHLANIFSVKDGVIDYRDFTRRDLVSRFIRNVHPCNYFLIPKQGWQQRESDPRVASFFAEQYERRYDGVWSEFVAMVGSGVGEMATAAGSIQYAYGLEQATRLRTVGA